MTGPVVVQRLTLLRMIAEGNDTAQTLFSALFGYTLPFNPFVPPVSAEVRAMHDALQRSKDAGEIALDASGSGSRWVIL